MHTDSTAVQRTLPIPPTSYSWKVIPSLTFTMIQLPSPYEKHYHKNIGFIMEKKMCFTNSPKLYRKIGGDV